MPEVVPGLRLLRLLGMVRCLLTTTSRRSGPRPHSSTSAFFSTVHTRGTQCLIVEPPRSPPPLPQSRGRQHAFRPEARCSGAGPRRDGSPPPSSDPSSIATWIAPFTQPVSLLLEYRATCTQNHNAPLRHKRWAGQPSNLGTPPEGTGWKPEMRFRNATVARDRLPTCFRFGKSFSFVGRHPRSHVDFSRPRSPS